MDGDLTRPRTHPSLAGRIRRAARQFSCEDRSRGLFADRFTYLEVIDEPAAESPSDSGGRVLSPKLRGDTKLVSGLRASVTAASGEDGWANLAAVGNLMRNQQPDFDSRNWGYTKLSDLVRATELFVVETRPTGGLHVKDRRKASV